MNHSDFRRTLLRLPVHTGIIAVLRNQLVMRADFLNIAVHHENDFVLMEVIAEYLVKNHAGFREVFEHIH